MEVVIRKLLVISIEEVQKLLFRSMAQDNGTADINIIIEKLDGLRSEYFKNCLKII